MHRELIISPSPSTSVSSSTSAMEIHAQLLTLRTCALSANKKLKHGRVICDGIATRIRYGGIFTVTIANFSENVPVNVF